MITRRKLVSSILTLLLALGLVLYDRIQSLIQNETNFDTPTVTTISQQLKEWSYNEFPDYYAVIGDAQIDESKFGDINGLKNETNNGLVVKYTGKDNLGRTLPVYAITSFKAVQKSSAEERPNFKQNDSPSGWTRNEEVSIETSTGTYKGWFWNRSHLLADRLGGKATSDNAITGTRMQNVGNRSNSGGMYYIEERTVDYLRTHRSAYVYYAVTPVYEKTELIPRYVIVDVRSEDGLLNERVVTYNYQNGYTVDYQNGGFTKN